MKKQFDNKLNTIKSSMAKTLAEEGNKNQSKNENQSKSHSKSIEDLKSGMEIREHQLLEEIDMLKETMHKIVTSQNNN